MLRQQGRERSGVGFAHGAHRAQLFVEQRGYRISLHQRCHIDIHRRMRGEGHFRERYRQPTVGTVVVGHQQASIGSRANSAKERLQACGVVEVWRHVTQLPIHLRQARTAQPLLAGAEVQQEQARVPRFLRDVWRERAAHIAHRRERRDNKRHRRPHRLFGGSALFRPARAHGQRILTDRNGDIQRRAQLHAHRAHGVEQGGIFGCIATSRHPVRRELHIAHGAHIGSHDIRERLRHRHPARSRTRQQRQRRAFAHGHGFTGIRAEACSGDGHVCHGNLPRADHGVAVDETTHTAVANGDEEGLVCHRGQVQQAVQCFTHGDTCRGQGRRHALHALRTARHLRRLAEQHVDGQLHGRITKVRVVHLQQAVVCGVANNCERATLTRAQRREFVDTFRRQHQHIAFLAFVTPQLERRHARLVIQDAAQVDATAEVAMGHRFRHRIGKTTSAHIVDKQDGIGIAERPAGVDDFLNPPLHFRVATLHGGKVEVRAARATVHGRSSTATQPDEHGRATEHDDGRARRNVALLDVLTADVAETTRQHDGLVVTTRDVGRVPGDRYFVSAEVTENAGTPEFVVEGSRAQRTFRHDVERRSNTRRLRLRAFPGLFEAGDTQVRHREARETSLRLRAAARGTFIANFAARARGSTGKRRDGRRVVVRLHFHQDIDGLFVKAECARGRVRPQPRGRRAFNDRSIVAVSRKHARRAVRMCVANHGEQGFRLCLAIHGPVRVEDFVAAVFAVRLREHHQLHVGRVAFQLGVGGQQIVELVLCQRQPQTAVGGFECRAAFRHYGHGGQFTRGRVAEQARRRGFIREHRVRHAIVQQGCQRFHRCRSQRRRCLQGITHAAFNAVHLREATAPRNVRGLARPRRNSAETRHHEQR